MRLFVALLPPAAALNELDAAVAPLRPGWPDLRWAGQDRWHVTLAFLGEVADPASLLGPLAAVCAASSPFSLSLAGSGSFGSRGPVWVGVDGDVDRLAGLARRVRQAVRGAGVDVERRRYRPHLTVGRRRQPDPALLASYAGPAWPVVEVELVHSRLGRPVVHTVLERWPLGGDGRRR